MSYRREIDGLRAVAVLPVILFHAGFATFEGGYVGVDVFFVISGYLITGILITELEQGDFSMVRFYERRARRILPALFFVMLICVPFSYLWMFPSQLQDFSQSLVAVVLFSSNILFWREEGYFSASAELKPLLHTWSLAVEEQYYLLFPVFLFLVWRFGRTRVFWFVVGLAAMSLLLAEWGWRNKPSANFFLAPTRAWELLAGSICAFLTTGRPQRSSNVLGAVGLAMIGFAIFRFDANTPFPSLFTLVPVIGTVLIILYATDRTLVARALSTRLLVGIGLISYSAYLWHQPLFAFARLRSLTEPSEFLMVALGAASLVLAALTWVYVEQPFRKRAGVVRVSRQNVFAFSAVMGATFVAFGLAGHSGKVFESQAAAETSFARLDTRISANLGLHVDCEGAFNNSRNCQTAREPRILLWGDSFAMHLAQGILSDEPGASLRQHTLSTCAPILGIAPLGGDMTEDWARRCIEFNDQVLAWLEKQPQVDLVILSSSLEAVLDGDLMTEKGEVMRGDSTRYVAEKLRESADAIRSTGAEIVFVSPTPSSGWDIGQCSLRSVYFSEDDDRCNFPLQLQTRPYQLLRMVSDDVPVYWIHKDICAGGVCDVIKGGTLIYRDEGHLSREGSAYLGRTHDWVQEFRRLAH